MLWQGFAFNVSDAGREPDRFQGVYISWDIFQAIGERPILGRDFVPEDDKPGAPPVVIISHNLWQSRYGGDPNGDRQTGHDQCLHADHHRRHAARADSFPRATISGFRSSTCPRA